MKPVTPEFVRELIDFAPTEESRERGFAAWQLEGTVALFNMLARNRCAYLADEVGMGKTYVALGVMALVRYFDPSARIVVIAPRENIQRKWIKELQNFVRLNWRIVGNRVKSVQGGPAWEPVLCGSLLDFAHEALLHADRDFFLRMTSFSLALKDPKNRRRLRRDLRRLVPWADSASLSGRTPEAFRDGFGSALNAAIPDADLVVVDEAHNLKHGLVGRSSTRNRVMALAFGHPEGAPGAGEWYGPRAKRVLLLSATPFEEDYSAIQHQLDVFGFGKARLRAPNVDSALRVRDLVDPDVDEETKREIVGRLMVRRVSGLKVAGQLHTKNMYRREWRRGGYRTHDDPMRIDDPKQRLVVALMQKKVAEVLQDERFNNHFQIGMLSSFESFLESVSTTRRRRAGAEDDSSDSGGQGEPTFDGDQGETDDERKGIDADAIGEIVASFRRRFGQGLPHPKLDATASALSSAFETGEKALVFVRRVATVDELAGKLDRAFDVWIRGRMEAALPGATSEISELFDQYDDERARRSDEVLEDAPVDAEEAETVEEFEDRRFVTEEDEGSAETFFAWFFRGKGPPKVLSGAAFQKNRLSGQGSAYSTLLEDDHVAWLLGGPDDVISALGEQLGMPQADLRLALRARAYHQFLERTSRASGYPRLQVFQAYQMAALELMSNGGDEIAQQAQVVLGERFPGPPGEETAPPDGFPGPDGFLGCTTFFTELVKRPELRDRLWPREELPDFRLQFRRREQRRELLSAMARLGASYIDLYLLAIRGIGSFALSRDADSGDPEALARGFVELLDEQMNLPGFHAFYELSSAAAALDLLMGVNFPDVPGASLEELAAIYGQTLQKQVPVGRTAGGVNKRLVRQFRMPGFPLVMATTDVLQEGEDLHTFCRKVIHYGITWTPSAMEQRTGRIDRIGSLVQRAIDGAEDLPTPDQWIQVFYPHLRDTVEVLQVRRVLHRVNRFLRLIHKRREEPSELSSRIDAAREILEQLEDVEPLVGPLESAFPVDDEWLDGALTPTDVERPDISGQEAHLAKLWQQLVDEFQIEPMRTPRPLLEEGLARITGAGLTPRVEPPTSDCIQRFRLQLRSQAAGDATLLHCESLVGLLDLRDDETLDALYEQQHALGQPKVCVCPDVRDRREEVTVEGEILFDHRVTQFEELKHLVERTVVAASDLHRALVTEQTEHRRKRRRRRRR